MSTTTTLLGLGIAGAVGYAILANAPKIGTYVGAQVGAGLSNIFGGISGAVTSAIDTISASGAAAGSAAYDKQEIAWINTLNNVDILGGFATAPAGMYDSSVLAAAQARLTSLGGSTSPSSGGGSAGGGGGGGAGGRDFISPSSPSTSPPANNPAPPSNNSGWDAFAGNTSGPVVTPGTGYHYEQDPRGGGMIAVPN